MKLLFEETCLLERAQAQGYVTSDGRDNYDPVLEAYRDWCRVQRRPFLHLALGEATARVIFSLLEAETVWRVKTEKQLLLDTIIMDGTIKKMHIYKMADI